MLSNYHRILLNKYKCTILDGQFVYSHYLVHLYFCYETPAEYVMVKGQMMLLYKDKKSKFQSSLSYSIWEPRNRQMSNLWTNLVTEPNWL